MAEKPPLDYEAIQAMKLMSIIASIIVNSKNPTKIISFSHFHNIQANFFHGRMHKTTMSCLYYINIPNPTYIICSTLSLFAFSIWKLCKIWVGKFETRIFSTYIMLYYTLKLLPSNRSCLGRQYFCVNWFETEFWQFCLCVGRRWKHVIVCPIRLYVTLEKNYESNVSVWYIEGVI
jgi:hypothetical protein